MVIECVYLLFFLVRLGFFGFKFFLKVNYYLIMYYVNLVDWYIK